MGFTLIIKISVPDEAGLIFFKVNLKHVMKNKQSFERDAHSMTGSGSLDLFKKQDLNALAVDMIPNYNPDRFDAFGLRFYANNREPVITLYAVDKSKQEQGDFPKDKLPVKKFKLRYDFQNFIKMIKSMDMTLTTQAYDIDDMLVINK